MFFLKHWQSMLVSDVWSIHWTGTNIDLGKDIIILPLYLSKSISLVDLRSKDLNPDMLRFNLRSAIHVL